VERIAMTDTESTQPEDSSALEDVSAPDSEQRRANLAAAIADVEAGVRAETYDTDGENTEQ
jgi:hypothetical protein